MCLLRLFPALAVFLTLDLASNILGLMYTKHYAVLWTYMEPLCWIGQAVMVTEIWQRWTRGYKDIGPTGFVIALCFAVISIGVSFSLSGTEWSLLAWSHHKRFFYLFRRGLVVALALFLWLVIWFTRYFETDVSENLRRHTIIATCFFTALSGQQILFNFGVRAWVEGFQIAYEGIYLLAFCAWGLCLTRAGEKISTPPYISPDKIADFEERSREYLRKLRRIK